MFFKSKVKSNLEKCGELMGLLYYPYIKWAEERIKHEQVFAAMRGGKPILHAAKVAHEHKKADTGHWQEMWINRELVSSAFELSPNAKIGAVLRAILDLDLHNHTKCVQKYINKLTNGKPFTLLDNGYNGTITNGLMQYGFDDIQTLLLAGTPRFLDGKGDRGAYLTEMMDRGRFSRIPNSLPAKYHDYGCLKNIGQVARQNIKACKTFYNGMTNGVLLSANYQKTPDKEQVGALLRCIAINGAGTFDPALESKKIRGDGNAMFDAMYNKAKGIFR